MQPIKLCYLAVLRLRNYASYFDDCSIKDRTQDFKNITVICGSIVT